jgi:cation diffusion facilitator family transporter
MGMEKKSKRKRFNGDLPELVMLSLFKQGALGLKEIEKATALQSAPFQISQRSKRHAKEQGSVDDVCANLVEKNLIKINAEGKYELTDEGRVRAGKSNDAMERGAKIMESHVLSPTATARNTTVGYVVLSLVKLFLGFFSGSVGLIADGADTAVDTVASSIVYCGIRFKKEILGTIKIIGLMFVTAITLLYEAAVSVIENINGAFLPMTMPIVVIIVEVIAAVTMLTMSLYQRFVGKRNQSLSLISQSIDSKNSVYSSLAVMVGAMFSIFGIYWVDALVGGFISVRITMDGFGLSRQVYRSIKGEKTDFTKFKLPFEKEIEQRRFEAFRNWILYAVHEDKISTKTEIIDSLEATFRPAYIPRLFSDFTVGKMFDFETHFDRIIQPLTEETYLIEKNGAFTLTTAGKAYIKGTISSSRYKRSDCKG